MKPMRVTESVNALGRAICLYDFVMSAKYVDMVYPMDITKEMQEELKDLHPSMIIGGGVIGLNMYKITYQYSTKRDNGKTGKKYMFANATEMAADDFEASIMVEGEFINWVTRFNAKFPFRSISNVKILEVVPCACANLSIG